MKPPPLQPPDSHHLSAAVGWLGLGNPTEAGGELEKIAPEYRAHPGVLMVRHEVYAKAAKWDMADEVARELIQISPDDVQFWIWHAYSTRRMPGGGIPQAREILAKAQQLFPKESLIPYNLACYECQLGNQNAARTWLEKAFDLGDRKQLKQLALKDPDLEPFWPELGEI